MSTTPVQRKAQSFRLRTDLLERLKQKADESHRSLNNYVETLLLEMLAEDSAIAAEPEPQYDLTERICQGLREVKMVRDGKMKAKSIQEVLDELDDEDENK